MSRKTSVRAVAVIALAFAAGGLAVAAPAQAEAPSAVEIVSPAEQKRDDFGVNEQKRDDFGVNHQDWGNHAFGTDNDCGHCGTG